MRSLLYSIETIAIQILKKNILNSDDYRKYFILIRWQRDSRADQSVTVITFGTSESLCWNYIGYQFIFPYVTTPMIEDKNTPSLNSVCDMTLMVEKAPPVMNKQSWIRSNIICSSNLHSNKSWAWQQLWCSVN